MLAVSTRHIPIFVLWCPLNMLQDPAWRPDFFLSELKGLKKKATQFSIQEAFSNARAGRHSPFSMSFFVPLESQGILPKMRPQDYLRMDAAFVQKASAALVCLQKTCVPLCMQLFRFLTLDFGKVVAAYKANKKAEKKKRKKKKKKKEKKEKKEGKKKKEKKEGKEKKRKEKDAGGQGQQVKKEHHEVQKRRSKVVLDDAGQPTCKEELEIVEVRRTSNKQT